MKKEANELAWQRAIDELGLDERISLNGIATVTADELRNYREPRLMAKFDALEDLPLSLRSRGWAILSITNNSYVLGDIQTHLSLPKINSGTVPIVWESSLDTLSKEDITNETSVAMIAHHSKALENFIGESLNLTHFGRQRSGRFSCSISGADRSHELQIDGIQFEIDAGFEGKNSVVVMEVKLGMPSSINIRQLYFPFRHWLGRTSKLVIPTFAVWQNSRLDLYQVSFPIFDDFSSAEISAHASYVFKGNGLTITALERFAAEAKDKENEFPFPQANRVDKLLEIWNFLNELRSVEDVAKYLEFDTRQASYYLNALGFLDLAEKVEQSWIAKLDRKHTGPSDPIQDELILRFLAIAPVAKTFLHGNRFKKGQFSESEARKTLEVSSWGATLSKETIHRRAQCIVAWCQWIDSRITN